MKRIAALIFFFSVSIFLNAQLPMLQWARSCGSTNNDMGTSVAIDASGNVYTAGYFAGTADFDPGAGVYNLTSAGGFDIFILKLDANGNFVWAKNMGGSNHDFAWSIKLDASGNVYTTGSFLVTADFDPGASVNNLTSAGAEDVFVSKLDASGNFVWAKQLGGTSFDVGESVAIDATGNVHIGGYFGGTGDYDPGVGVSNLTALGNEDIFICKLNSSGNFVWAKQIGSFTSDYINSIAVDASGNVYSTGSFQFTADFDPNAGVAALSSAGGDDVFISKLDASGNYVWAKSMGGAKSDIAFGLALDAGNVVVTGNYDSIADFDPGASVYNLTADSAGDIFVCKLNSAGNFVWAKSMGGKLADNGQAITVDATGNVFTTGYFGGVADFDPGASAYTYTCAGATDVFISKLDATGNFLWAERLGNIIYDYGLGITVDATGSDIYTTGFFQDTVDFDPLLTTYTLATVGALDIFVHKMIPSTVDVKKMEMQNSEFKLFPNPGNGIFYITKMENESVLVYDVFGELILRSSDKEINLSVFPVGIYFVRVGDRSGKIVKE